MSNIPEHKLKEIREAKENITSIDLSNLGLNDDDMVELQELLQNKPHITSLNLSFNFISVDGCKVLKLLPHLRNINFSHNHLGDAAIDHLVATKINILDISHNGLSDIGANKLIPHLDKYTELYITGNPGISTELINKIRCHFGKEAISDEPPIGIDLGCNYHSYCDFLKSNNLPYNPDLEVTFIETVPAVFEKKPPASYPISSPKTSRAHKLANELFEARATDFLSLSPPEKEEFIKHLGKSIGIDVDLKPHNSLKV